MSQPEKKEWYEEKEWIDKIREPVTMTIPEAYALYYGQGRATFSTFKRKAKGVEYSTPRIFLRRYFNKYLGKRCLAMEAKVTIEDRPYAQNSDAIIIVFPKEVI